MDLDQLLRLFWSRPVYQRVFLAFTVGVFLSCSVKMAGAQPASRTLPASAGHPAPVNVVE